MDVGAKIKEFRIKAGLTRRKLANAIDITESGLFKIEKGERSPSFVNVRKIAEVLNISLDEFK